jgi:glycosyltransferase involved in cell wall biosynthesis
VKLSIIIPAFNEERLLPATLAAVRQSIGALDERGITWEIIVCDNNSTDRTAEAARQAGANVVFEPVNQISRARNTGAASATGDWLLFLDADSTPTRELFADLAEAMNDAQVCGGGATLRCDEAPFKFRAVMHLWNTISRLRNEIAGSFFFIRAEAFRTIEGFSAKLFAAEELDLTKKLKAWGKPRKQRVRILHHHPLATSARKMHLYSDWEHLRFFFRSAITRMKSLESRDTCDLWYDGRR